MAYDEKLADRVREELVSAENVKEKKMIGGLCFMINGKMCVGIANDELMARVGPHVYEEALSKPGCREMDFTGKVLKGYVFVGGEGIKGKKNLSYWISLALAFNKEAKASKRKSKGGSSEKQKS